MPTAYRDHPDLQTLTPPQQSRVQSLLRERAGVPSAPRMIAEPERPAEVLRRAGVLFARHCTVCHGLSGDGTGVASEFLSQRPRDFRRGIFKFQSTPYGARPTREDLVRTITRGLPGTLMPPFGRLPTEEIELLTDAVIGLSRRGELERGLILAAQTGEEPTAELADELTADIAAAWNEALSAVIEPLSPQPELDSAAAGRGRVAFASKGCAKCHGADGRGETGANLREGLRDAWGQPVRAADLTTGRLKGGRRPIDVYRRILGGINGTPMPSFRAILWTEPETIWDLTAYVLQLGNDPAPEGPQSRETVPPTTREPRQ